MKITITQEDIDSSFEYHEENKHKDYKEFNWECNCPLAYALNRQTNRKWKVGSGIFRPVDTESWKETSNVVRDFVDFVDDEFEKGETENIEPESFILDVEQFDEISQKPLAKPGSV